MLSNIVEKQSKQMKDHSDKLVELESEISGIPNDVKDADLRDKVINIASTIQVEITANGIGVVHRLKLKPRDKGTARAICHFVSKQYSYDLLKGADPRCFF